MRVAELTPVQIPASASFAACLAAVLEEDLPELPASDGSDPASVGVASRWLGGLGLGLARVAQPDSFSWAGPWIARVRPPAGSERFVVMYGVPSGVIWDPAGDGHVDNDWIEDGYLLAAGDIALARPPRPRAPETTGRVQEIWISPRAGEPATSVSGARALPGRGLEGDRHVTGAGTF